MILAIFNVINFFEDHRDKDQVQLDRIANPPATTYSMSSSRLNVLSTTVETCSPVAFDGEKYPLSDINIQTQIHVLAHIRSTEYIDYYSLMVKV